MLDDVNLFDGRYRSFLFDMDGVLTDTATVHAAAWKRAFDEFLTARGDDRLFDVKADYLPYVDGKPRNDGVRDFLHSRGVILPEGEPDDPPTAQTVWGVGNRKNEFILQVLRDEGVSVYASSIDLVRTLRSHGYRTGVVSASANTAAVLESAGVTELFDVRVDGVTILQEQLRGKPEPDTFLAAAAALDTEPQDAVVFEDALAGVQSGCRGHFGLVVGVDRVGHAEALLRNGADVVVTDLGQLLPASKGDSQ